MEQLLNHLRNLGFTELEAKVIIALAQQGTQSGYEVAKRIGVSRSNVYATLQRLSTRGVVQLTPGEPARYSVLPVKELTRMIAGQIGESLSYLEQAMPTRMEEPPAFYSVEGERRIMEIMSRELDRAEDEIIAAIWQQEAAWFRPQLEQAEKRGVRVLWSFEDVDDEAHPGIRLLREGTSGRKFWLVIDRRWCIVGMRGDSMPAQALVTEHPLMAELLLQHFSQEVILYEMENDLGEELIRRYGKGYGRILERYLPGLLPLEE
ncbi:MULTISPECIES: TrmB family transcriptional regulator [Paenibacillus]|uniref:TrmB family transcriptional regulator n=1 Tax=Paenibacillus TaxID=44249 RepID=UPI000374B177|nr:MULTISPECIES: TrmB family transcriptional regulator [Paenibacillus]